MLNPHLDASIPGHLLDRVACAIYQVTMQCEEPTNPLAYAEIDSEWIDLVWRKIPPFQRRTARLQAQAAIKTLVS